MLNTLDCKYNASDVAFIGTNGQPVGDPSWGSSVINSLDNHMINRMELANYPNPFSDQTALRFTLSESSDVSIVITDITGKQLRSEKLGRYSSGTNSVIINKNELKSGMYFLKMNTEQEQGTLVLMVK